MYRKRVNILVAFGLLSGIVSSNVADGFIIEEHYVEKNSNSNQNISLGTRIESPKKRVEKPATIKYQKNECINIYYGYCSSKAKEEKQRMASLALKKKSAKKIKGIVYKSDNFWSQFNEMDETRKVFDGEFNGLTTQPKYMIAYQDFVHVYGDICTSKLPKKIDKRIYTNQTIHKDAYGNEKYRDKANVIEVKLDPRFTDKYDEYENSKTVKSHELNKGLQGLADIFFGDGRDKMAEAMFSGGFAKVAEEGLAKSPNYQMRRLVSSVGCSSATIYQLRENFWRVAHGKRSLQEDKFRIKGAEKESE